MAGAAGVLMVAWVAAACGGSQDPTVAGGVTTSAPTAASSTTMPVREIPGVQTFAITIVDHVTGSVTYAETPPVAGAHAATPQNCGFYSAPVANEAAVHSLEHGVIWITYRAGLAQTEIDRLRTLAAQPKILVSMWPAESATPLPAPVVASAWNRQLRLDSASDPRLAEFISAFRSGPQSPEPLAGCTGGVGVPG